MRFFYNAFSLIRFNILSIQISYIEIDNAFQDYL
jgi:hypothetical protein